MKTADSLYRSGNLDSALLIYQQAQHFSVKGNYSKDSIQKVKYLLEKQYIANNYLFDKYGRLRIDTTQSIGQRELAQLKNNRVEISFQIIRKLKEYEKKLYKEELPKLNYDFTQLPPYQIKDTTKHLYKITCDSSEILSVEHILLSNHKEYGFLADSIIRMTFPSLLSYLKSTDHTINEFLIPVIYIPRRHNYPSKITSHYCNCQICGCLPMENGVFDEFYFVITDGQLIIPH